MSDAPRQLVLVKHALPILDAERPAREWVLGPEGENQARVLARALRRFRPFHLSASTEPKATRTADIIAGELGIPVHMSDDLREIDRPVLPVMSRAEHDRFNRRLFAEFDRPVIGRESARAARDRFAAAVSAIVAGDPAANHVVVAHGTVIALLVAAGEGAVELWRRLECPSFVVVGLPSMQVREIVEHVC